MQAVAGIDLGGTAVNYTLLNEHEKFLIEVLCEHPALAKQGPVVCLQQIADGLKIATEKAGVTNCDFKGAHNALDIFGVVATLDVPARSRSDESPVPYDMHGATQWQRSRFV